MYRPIDYSRTLDGEQVCFRHEGRIRTVVMVDDNWKHFCEQMDGFPSELRVAITRALMKGRREWPRRRAAA